MPIKYPGYVWDTVEHKLYSFKSGSLKPLKLQLGNRFTYFQYLAYYTVSHKGKPIVMYVKDLKRIVEDGKIHTVKILTQ